jgi:transposase-like protein
MAYMFSKNVPGNMCKALMVGNVSENTIYQWYHFYRGLFSRYLLDHPVKLGGPGDIVEIDESKWGRKRKYGRGHVSPNHPWVFGLISRRTNKVVVLTVNRRTKAELIPKIQQVVIPGSTIYSDDWRAYRCLTNYGYNHEYVTHCHNFVDPITHVHTNTIEGFWGHAKNPFKQMHGCPRDHINEFLDELMLRWNMKDRDLFSFLLEQIGNYYNPKDVIAGDVPPAPLPTYNDNL